MRFPILLAFAVFAATFTAASAQEASTPVNLLLNPTFEFHAFNNHRAGEAVSYRSQSVACWNTDTWGDITVTRESHAPADIRPDFSTGNLVSIEPGKRFWQFFTLPEAGLAPGERISLFAYGHQPSAGALRASIKLMKIEAEDGEWTPADFGYADKRTFEKHARGELVVAKEYAATSDAVGACKLTIDAAEIIAHYADEATSHTDDMNTVGIRVEFENTSDSGDVWLYYPSLSRSDAAVAKLPPVREMPTAYRHIPRTIQKLWKGEPIHVLLMGSSIDRGSCNPPNYLYDEDPASPTFKQPLSESDFDGSLISRPDLDGYYGWWRHYFSYAGRLRTELMRKFDLPASKILINFMACDGSCVGEAHSGLAEYCSLSLPPNPNTNGHQAERSWDELYPELMTRSGGSGPDLVIFGSGANEKTDTPDEAAVFEGMIRWIQQHYPGCEFLFCMFQNQGGYTPNAGDLQALALRYQIPVLDFGKVEDGTRRWAKKAMTKADGHPQASGHYLWFKQLEKAFECSDPIQPGQAQLYLPERMMPGAYGWEGEILTFSADDPRIQNGRFIFEDMAVNCWGFSEASDRTPTFVDGVEQTNRRNSPSRDLRNSMFRYGRTTLGDRHILELGGTNPKLTAVDAKICPNRHFYPVSSPIWDLAATRTEDFSSDWGAPYGTKQAILSPGQAFAIEAIATDISIAYVDAPDAGTLHVTIDGQERLIQPANVPFTDIGGTAHFIENRRGIRDLGYGLHTIHIQATDAPVAILGLYTYDSRSNLATERRLMGRATAGETIRFTRPFKARPIVICHGDLTAPTADITPAQVTFSGAGTGTYAIIGE